jgi:hypothetical protein
MNAKQLIISASGFPGTNKTLRFLQDAYQQPLEAISRVLGDKVILSGVVITDDGINPATVSDGYIAIDGMIVPFTGGLYQATITVYENVENATYNTDINNDNTLDSLPAYKYRTANCGTGGVDIYNFSDFVRLETIKTLSPLKDIVAALQVNDALQQASINGLNARETKKHIIVQYGVAVNSAAAVAQPIFSNGTTLGKFPVIANHVYKFDISVDISYNSFNNSNVSFGISTTDGPNVSSLASSETLIKKGNQAVQTNLFGSLPSVFSVSDTTNYAKVKSSGFFIPIGNCNILPTISKDVTTPSGSGTLRAIMIIEDLGLASDYDDNWI